MEAPEILSVNNLFDCNGLVAVITGGGTGIGLIMARTLAYNGATVYILGRRLDKLESAVSASNFSGSNGRLISLSSAVTHISKASGYVNIVIANAGTVGPNNRALLPREPNDSHCQLSLAQVQESLWAIPAESLLETYSVNVVGALNTAVAFLGLLDEGNKKGNVPHTSQVLVTSSIGGFHRSWPQAGIAYTTSKAAVNHLVKSLASFLIQWKIRVNGLAPGLFPSEMTAAVFGDKDISAEGSMPEWLSPMKRGAVLRVASGCVLLGDNTCCRWWQTWLYGRLDLLE